MVLKDDPKSIYTKVSTNCVCKNDRVGRYFIDKERSDKT